MTQGRTTQHKISQDKRNQHCAISASQDETRYDKKHKTKAFTRLFIYFFSNMIVKMRLISKFGKHDECLFCLVTIQCCDYLVLRLSSLVILLSFLVCPVRLAQRTCIQASCREKNGSYHLVLHATVNGFFSMRKIVNGHIHHQFVVPTELELLGVKGQARRRDKIRQYKTRQSKIRRTQRPLKTRQGETRQDKTRQDTIRHYRTRQDKTRQGKARQDLTRPRQDKTNQY